jgi:hypothetical protein
VLPFWDSNSLQYTLCQLTPRCAPTAQLPRTASRRESCRQHHSCGRQTCCWPSRAPPRHNSRDAGEVLHPCSSSIDSSQIQLHQSVLQLVASCALFTFALIFSSCSTACAFVGQVGDKGKLFNQVKGASFKLQHCHPAACFRRIEPFSLLKMCANYLMGIFKKCTLVNRVTERAACARLRKRTHRCAARVRNLSDID